MESFEAVDRVGMIWVRSRGSNSRFPDFTGEQLGYRMMTQLVHDIEAPLECVLDNFTELEHTPTTHGMFGYRLDRMNEVDVSVEAADDHLEIEYHGPCKTYPFISRSFLRLSRHAMFHVQGSVYYSPVHVFGDYKWTDEGTGRDNPVGIRNAHFLTPLNDQRTRVFTMSFMKMDDPRYTPLLHLAKPFVRHTINKEVLEDKRVLDGLADKSPDIRGLKLSRFDRVVGLHRDRIAKIYRGGQQNPTRLAASFPPDPVSSEQD